MEQVKLLYIVHANIKKYNCFEKSSVKFLTELKIYLFYDQNTKLSCLSKINKDT